MAIIKKVPIKVAAAMMQKSAQFVRRGLIAGKLPFGAAFKVTGGTYSYYISPKLFADFTGCSIEDIQRACEE